jgi:hypothetical protein
MTLLPILWKKGDIAMTTFVSDSMALLGKFAGFLADSVHIP